MKKISRTLTAKELSLVLNISEATVKKLAKTRQLPCRYERRRLVFDFGAVLRHFCKLEGGAA